MHKFTYKKISFICGAIMSANVFADPSMILGLTDLQDKVDAIFPKTFAVDSGTWNNGENTYVSKFLYECQDLVDCKTKWYLPTKDVTNFSFKVGRYNSNSIRYDGNNSYAIVDTLPQLESAPPIFIGTTTLENQTTRDQTLTTGGFSQTITSTTTTATTQGWSISAAIETSGKIGIPFVTEGGIKFTVSGGYNTSKTDSTSTSTSITYTAPSQGISVPPGYLAKVSAMLLTTNGKGDYTVYTSLKNPWAVNMMGSMTVDLYQMFSVAQKYNLLPSVLSVDPNSNSIFLVSRGKYSFNTGTDFLVNVKYIKQNGGQLKSSTAKVKDYSFKVPAVKITAPITSLSGSNILPW